jgi:hypothetical protein
MRHLPSVGAVIAPPDTHPYLVVKQDNNGTYPSSPADSDPVVVNPAEHRPT